MERTVLGVDLGGTKLLIGQVNKSGVILRSKQYPSGFLNQEQALRLILLSLEDYISTVGFVEPYPEVMGLGIVGLVDQSSGKWIMIDPDRKNPISITSILEERFQMAVGIDNDVKAATQAELRFGLGQSSKDFIYLNIGTGIAAGFVTDGSLIRGYQNDSGEVGHLSVDYRSNTPCVCGRFGCVEALASGGGMDRRIKLLGKRYPESPLLKLAALGFVDARDIFGLADEGDPLATLIAHDAVDAASELIVNLVRVTNPELVLLGGGVAGSSWMRRELPKRLHIRVMKTVHKGVQLSQLDPTVVGLIGAAAVGFTKQDQLSQ
ncbi:ROK family protein [Paenibacillus endoradicis]|uniref:ROK family protein n=1 Tax=Paenibacillus endoradicis TaxID=2972487 RepID=UPI002158A38F|nr:ROK family protein [Paenibacillus endoradicis]MCR8660401.1 ROK family protein [Paenibacillus endoradicis]